MGFTLHPDLHLEFLRELWHWQAWSPTPPSCPCSRSAIGATHSSPLVPRIAHALADAVALHQVFRQGGLSRALRSSVYLRIILTIISNKTQTLRWIKNY